MPDRRHASAHHPETHAGPDVHLPPEGATGAPGRPSLDGVAHDIGRGAPGAAAPLFSHFTEGAGAPVQKKEALPAGQEGFDKMWAAHPHNYQTDESKNT